MASLPVSPAIPCMDASFRLFGALFRHKGFVVLNVVQPLVEAQKLKVSSTVSKSWELRSASRRFDVYVG